MRIVDLTPADVALIDQAASLLMDGFADIGSTSWRTRADALETVRESLGADRVSRVALDDGGTVARASGAAICMRIRCALRRAS